ncbi:MAG: hypothetical protein RIT27_1627 [Pseudomonadota bacterium]|jgi:tetratricopeptide (TPR) repeat protein
MATSSSSISNPPYKSQKLVNKAWFWVVVVLAGGLSGWGLFNYSPPPPLASVPSDPPAPSSKLPDVSAQSAESPPDQSDPLWKWQTALDVALQRHDAPVAAETLHYIADFYFKNNQLEQAANHWQQAYKLLREALVKQDSIILKQQLVRILEELSDVQQQLKQFQAAWDSLNEAYQWRQQLVWHNPNPENYQALQQTYQKFTQLWQNAQTH